MKIFFYAHDYSNEAREYSDRLLNKKSLESLTILPAGEKLGGKVSLSLRNGDVMILFAATTQELNSLLAIHRIFDEFRVILVLKHQETSSIPASSHILKPRFITFANSDTSNIEEVIMKMQDHSDNSATVN